MSRPPFGFRPEPSQHAQERLARNVQLGRHNTFGMFKFNLEGALA